MIHFRNFFFFLLCIGFLGLMFYWRVVYLREPRPLSLEFNVFRLTIGSYIILMCLLSLYKQVFVKESTNSFFKNLADLYMLSIDAIIEGFFLFITRYTWGANCIYKLGDAFLIFKFAPLDYIYIGLVTIPTFFASLIFFLDVVIFNYFSYFYKVIPFLMIPLFVVFFKTILKHWADCIFSELACCIVKTSTEIIDNGDGTGRDVSNFAWAPDYIPDEDEDLEIYIISYHRTISISNIVDEMEETQGYKFVKIMNIIRTLLILTAWSYWIFFMLYSL